MLFIQDDDCFASAVHAPPAWPGACPPRPRSESSLASPQFDPSTRYAAGEGRANTATATASVYVTRGYSIAERAPPRLDRSLVHYLRHCACFRTTPELARWPSSTGVESSQVESALWALSES